VSANGLTNGVIRGAVPWVEVDQKFIPMIAAEATATLQAPTTPQNVKDALTIAFDINKDTVISADEIRKSELLKLVLKPDVDMDGDKTPDSLSAAMAFTAVRCSIQR
jgi:predicted secreted protein